MTNFQEYLAGTDPTDPLSRFWLQPVSFEAGALRLRWQAEINHSYTLEWTPSLSPGFVWTAIYNEPAQPFSQTVELMVPINGQPTGFFRVRTP